MKDRSLNGRNRWMRWMMVGVVAPLMQFAGCSFGVEDLQAAALRGVRDGVIETVSNGIFTATQTVFLNVFGV